MGIMHFNELKLKKHFEILTLNLLYICVNPKIEPYPFVSGIQPNITDQLFSVILELTNQSIQWTPGYTF